ncbi:hypothetical protein [Nocardia fluminea]|uniref:hypothetical protein n=1 Tax=Nocardia fluminea TaxID=134984 RepID=UPI00342B1036
MVLAVEDAVCGGITATCHVRYVGRRRPPRITVVEQFGKTTDAQGVPASTLTDNGLVYTTRFAGGGTGGRNGFETELAALGVTQKNSRPDHPTTPATAYNARPEAEPSIIPGAEGHHRVRHDTPSTPPAASPSATTPAYTTSASAEPIPAPWFYS